MGAGGQVVMLAGDGGTVGGFGKVSMGSVGSLADFDAVSSHVVYKTRWRESYFEFGGMQGYQTLTCYAGVHLYVPGGQVYGQV